MSARDNRKRKRRAARRLESARNVVTGVDIVRTPDGRWSVTTVKMRIREDGVRVFMSLSRTEV